MIGGEVIREIISVLVFKAHRHPYISRLDVSNIWMDIASGNIKALKDDLILIGFNNTIAKNIDIKNDWQKDNFYIVYLYNANPKSIDEVKLKEIESILKIKLYINFQQLIHFNKLL